MPATQDEPTVSETGTVRALLAPGALDVHFQPIVRLEDGHAIGYEALVRPGLEPLTGPERFLAAAGRARLRSEAELACWRAAIDAGAPPGDRRLFLNVSPAALVDPGFRAMGEHLASRLVIELTERESLDDHDALRRVLEPWLDRGAMLALDDVGAGFASLESILELHPHFIKLGHRLVGNVDRDRNRRSLLAFVASYARDTRVTLVAEGVERREELAVVRALGIDCAQGFLLARPGPPWPEVTAPPGRSSHLTRRLERDDRAGSPRAAATVAEACSLVAERFARDLMLPSIYLERDGVLRCEALRGYWQLLDGFPPGAGIIGAVYADGQPRLLHDVTAADDYLEVAPEVCAEAAVPIRVRGRVVGVLNVESPVALADGLLDEMRDAADALGARLADLPPPDSTSAARVAGHAAVLAGLTDEREIAGRVVEATRDVVALSSGTVALAGGDGDLAVVVAEGPLAGALRALPAATLAKMAGWVQGVRSVYTWGGGDGRGLVGHQELRQAGVEALVVLPLSAHDGRAGMLVLAHDEPLPLTANDVELLELLAVLASSSLSTAAAVRALSDQAASDSLTGLGHQATFRTALRDARARAPRHRYVGAILVDVDGFKAINDSRGHLAGDQVLRSVSGALAGALRSSDSLYRVGGDEFAAIVEVGSSEESLAVAHRLVGAVRTLGEVSVSVGAALAAEDESDVSLFARADAALYAVKRRGRDDAELARRPLGAASAPGQTRLWV